MAVNLINFVAFSGVKGSYITNDYKVVSENKLFFLWCYAQKHNAENLRRSMPKLFLKTH